MGFMRHHAIVVTCSTEASAKDIHALAIGLFEILNKPPQQVTDIVRARYNDYWSFMIGPDGSKECWAESNNGNLKRQRFIELVEKYNRAPYPPKQGHVEWVEVEYCGDGGDPIARSRG